MSEWYLTILIFLPLVGAIILLFVPGAAHALLRNVALAVSLVVFAVSVPLWFQYDFNSGAGAVPVYPECRLGPVAGHQIQGGR